VQWPFENRQTQSLFSQVIWTAIIYPPTQAKRPDVFVQPSRATTLIDLIIFNTVVLINTGMMNGSLFVISLCSAFGSPIRNYLPNKPVFSVSPWWQIII
jgi:hypothetical protein